MTTAADVAVECRRDGVPRTGVAIGLRLLTLVGAGHQRAAMVTDGVGAAGRIGGADVVCLR